MSTHARILGRFHWWLSDAQRGRQQSPGCLLCLGQPCWRSVVSCKGTSSGSIVFHWHFRKAERDELLCDDGSLGQLLSDFSKCGLAAPKPQRRKATAIRDTLKENQALGAWLLLQQEAASPQNPLEKAGLEIIHDICGGSWHLKTCRSGCRGQCVTTEVALWVIYHRKPVPHSFSLPPL